MINPLKLVINYLLPHRCLNCKELVATKHSLCQSCFKKLDFISSPICKICGYPFAINIADQFECGGCIQTPPPYSAARSIFKYNYNSRKLIHDFKYNDKTGHAKYFAHLLFDQHNSLISDADYLAAVPMNRYKRLYRHYNPPFLIAKELSSITKIKFIPDLLIKTKLTKPQTTLNKKERYVNLKGSIIFNENYDINGKKIVLIDDVHTTGTTGNVCASLLKKQKAKEVLFLSVART